MCPTREGFSGEGAGEAVTGYRLAQQEEADDGHRGGGDDGKGG